MSGIRFVLQAWTSHVYNWINSFKQTQSLGDDLGEEALRDLRSLWLVPALLITIISATIFSARYINGGKFNLVPVFVLSLIAFILIYITASRRAHTLASILQMRSERISASRDRLIALNVISQAIAKDLDLDSILKAICTETEKAIKNCNVSVRLGKSITSEPKTQTPDDPAQQKHILTYHIIGPTTEVFGILTATRVGIPFDDFDAELLQAVATQAATAINNAHNYAAVQRRSRDLRDLMMHGADAVAASEDINHIAEVLTKQTVNLLGCAGSGIFMFGEDRRLLSPVAYYIAEDKVWDKVKTSSFYTRPIALGEATLLKAVLSSSGPLSIEDVVAFTEGRAWSNVAGIGSMIAAPIVARSHGALGILIAHWAEHRLKFEPDESDLVGALAGFAAVTIENSKHAASARSEQKVLSEKNAKLLEETHRRRAELQKLVHRVGDALVAGLSSERIGQLVVEQVSQMIACHRAVFWIREDDTYYPIASSGFDKSVLTEWQMSSSHFLRDIIDRTNPLVVADVPNDGRFSDIERVQLCRQEIASMLFAPLRGRGDRAVGFLALYWTVTKYLPTPEEFETADVLATQAASAIENANLYLQLEEAEKRLSIQLEQTTAARDFVNRVLQNIPAAVFVVNASEDLIIQNANALAESMPDADYQRDGLVGRRLFDVFPGIDELIGTPIQKAIDTAESLSLFDVAYDGFTRGRTYWSYFVTPQRDPKMHKVGQIIILAQEVTERIKLLQENERNARRVENLVRISQQLNATLNMREIYNHVTEGAVSLVDVNSDVVVALFIRETTQSSYNLVAISSIVEVNAATRNTLSEIGIRPPLLRQLHISPKPIVLKIPETEAAPDNLSVIYVLPFISSHDLIGHLVLVSSVSNMFDDNRLADALVNLSSLSSAIIKNALAFAYEQNIAETLQKSFLPATPEHIEGLDIAARYFPRLIEEAEIGGDYYDLIVMGPKQLAIIIGDISGKGLSAAVYTAMAKYTLRAFIAQEMSCGEIVSRANTAVERWMTAGVFSTLFFGIVDTDKMSITYVNAGHELPQIIGKDDQRLITLETTGPMLGVFHTMDFEVRTTTLLPGDVLVLYTDGLTECRNDDREFFGEEGVRRLVKAIRDCDSDTIADSLYKAALDYTSGNRLHDDVALLVVKMSPS